MGHIKPEIIIIKNTFLIQTYKELKEEDYFVLISLWVPQNTNIDIKMQIEMLIVTIDHVLLKNNYKAFCCKVFMVRFLIAVRKINIAKDGVAHIN